MNVSISPELERRIAEMIARGDVCSADALVEQALQLYLEYEEQDTDSEQFRETGAAIAEALEQGERGEGRPAEDVFADLRARHGISR